MKILRLPIKGKWLGQIDAGIKKDEYRDIKAHYISRFFNNRPEYSLTDMFEMSIQGSTDINAELEYWGCTLREYDAVELIAGYSRTAKRSLYEFKGLSIGHGRRDWGAPADKNVFRIHLGNKIQ